MRAERLFRSPQLFRRNRPKIPCTWPKNPSRPASFLRQFSPQHSPVARLFRGKKGLFCPPAPAVPAFLPAQTPRFAPAPPVFLPGARPDGDPACPGFARDPGVRAHPLGPRNPPRVRLFCPPAPAFARRAPPERPKVAPPAAETTPPCAASPPVAAARRRGSAAAPPRHSLGAGNPDCRGRLSRFAVKKCATPRGDQIPGHDG